MNGTLFDSSEAEDFYPYVTADMEDDYGDYEDYGDFGDDYLDFGEDGEDFDYLGSDDAESRRSRRRARARAERERLKKLQRARALAKRSKSHRRLPPLRASVANQPALKGQVHRVANKTQQNTSAIQNVDLQNKVKTDMLARGLATQGKRISRGEYSQAASKVVDQLKKTFPDLENNTAVDTVLPLLPLLFLTPEKKGSGIGSVISDPRVWAPVITGGLAVFKALQGSKDTTTAKIDVPSSSLSLSAGASQYVGALARNSKGDAISGKRLVFGTSNSAVVKVSSDGLLDIPPGTQADSTADISVYDPETGEKATIKVTVK